MAEMKDTHVVEIPVDEEHQQKLISATQNHPLAEISESPGHLLLLKLWQREEDMFGRRISLKETRIDNIRSEIFQLCLFYLTFYGFFLTLLYTSSIDDDDSDNNHSSCHKWWIPSSLTVFTSLVIIFLVQFKLCRYWNVSKELLKERCDNRTLLRCIQELRMKGASFDLSKEPQNARRMKSSSVEIKWRPISWCCENLVTIFLVCFTGLIFPISKFILCN